MKQIINRRIMYSNPVIIRHMSGKNIIKNFKSQYYGIFLAHTKNI